MADLIERSGEFRVNGTPEGAHGASDVTALATGGYAFAWRSTEPSSGFRFTSYVERLTLFSNDGDRTFDDTVLGTGGVRFSASDISWRPTITQLTDGTLVTIWNTLTGTPSDFPPHSVVGRGLRRDGTTFDFVVEPETTLRTNFSSYFGADIAARADGGFVVVRQTAQDPISSGDFDVRARNFDANGAALPGDATVGTNLGTGDEPPVVARLADGTFRSVWGTATAGGYDVVVRPLSAAGTPSGAAVVVANATDPNQRPAVAVAGLTGGGYVVVWSELAGGTYDVRARVVSAAGVLGAAFTVSESLAGAQLDPSVAALSDGSFAVAWTDDSGSRGDLSGTAVHLRRFGADGAPLGVERLVNTTTEGSQRDSALAANSDGTVAVSWTDQATGAFTGNGLAVRAAVLQLVNSSEGGLGDDPLTGTEGADVLRGFAGNDTLRGLGGNDLLDGGAGDDTLDAGAGDDTVDPGAGRDTADGGAGNDTIVFTSLAAGIIADLLAGATWDGAVGETISNFENAVGTAFADSLFGTAGANRLEGRGGDDNLVGGDGDDRLEGGTGDDRLDPGAGADTVDGGLGTDTLNLIAAPASVIVDLNAGRTWDGAVADTLVSVENAVGTRFNDTIFGTELAANVIDGGPAGADTLVGGDGGPDTVSYASSERGVIIDFAENRTWDGVEADTLRGFEAATGSRFADQIFGTFTQTVNPGAGGADRIVNIGLLTYDSNARAVIIDLSQQLTYDGADQDTLSGIYQVRGSRFDDDIFGSSALDIIDGGAGFDRLFGGGGNDVFILRRGEADGDLIRDFAGGEGASDSITLSGYSAGSTVARLAGNATTWLVTDAATGAVDAIRVVGEAVLSDFNFNG